MDGGEISRAVRGDSPAREGRPLGDRGGDVGGAGPEHAGRRIAGAAAPARQTLLPGKIRRGRAHRVEPRFVRLQLAAPADLQEIRRGLFRDAKDAVERYDEVPAQNLL